MQCPVCKKDMVVLELDGVEIDHCLQCGGIWLDQGELARLSHNTGCEDALCAEKKDSHRTGGKLRCPYCARVMGPVKVQGSEGIVLDECSRQHGWWCDRGELEQILRKEGSAQALRVAGLLQEMFKHGTKKEEEKR